MIPQTPKQFELTQAERESHLWKKLMKHFEQRIANMRAQNDSDLDERTTARVRGRIAEVRDLMNLDKPRPDIEFE